MTCSKSGKMTILIMACSKSVKMTILNNYLDIVYWFKISRPK